MNLSFFYHRNSNLLVKHDIDFKSDYNELINVLKNITDDQLINEFQTLFNQRKKMKSLSVAINTLLRRKLLNLKWLSETGLFKEPPYNQSNRSRWRLDFSKNNISVEVAFNHQEATAHNIMKPVLASELNHVKKEVQTRLGVIIVVTNKMKDFGNFDGACGTFESFQEYFKPYNNIITVPIVLIGIQQPKSFKIDKKSKSITLI